MKKVYVKPTVEIESYELNEFVASCENTTPNHSRDDCVIDLDRGRFLLFQYVTKCRRKTDSIMDFVTISR